MTTATLDYKFEDALHGKAINLDFISGDQISAHSKRYLSCGSIGAILSHYALWKKASKAQEQCAIILEDDAVPRPDFKELINKIWKEVPEDFDIVFLGSGLSKKNDCRTCISKHLYIPYFPRRGMYAYVLSKKGALKFIDLIFPVLITFGGVDTIIGNLIRLGKIRGYHVDRPLCGIDAESPSNIFNFSRPKKRLHEAEIS